MNGYRQFLKVKCENCGIEDKRVLIGHHKDRNRDNNIEQNIKTLCYNCHKLIHAELNDLECIVELSPTEDSLPYNHTMVITPERQEMINKFRELFSHIHYLPQRLPLSKIYDKAIGIAIKKMLDIRTKEKAYDDRLILIEDKLFGTEMVDDKEKLGV